MALLFLRHGSTGLNAGDSDPVNGIDKADYFRGWSQQPLSPLGTGTVQETGEWFRKNKIPLQQIIASDLPRATQSAQLISQATGAPVQTDQRLRPLNVGALTEQKITDDKKKVLEYAHKNPDWQIPGGESYNEFLGRYKGILPDLLQAGQKSNILVVTHHRNLLALGSIFFGQTPTTKGPPNPGGLIALSDKGVKTLFEPSGSEKRAEKAQS